MGFGLWAPQLSYAPFRDLYALPPFTGDEGNQDAAQEWYFSGLEPPPAVEIPWTWLSGPLRFRQVKPFTYAAVTKTGGGTAIASVPAEEQIEFTATLASENDVDTSNLAHFMITYYDTPRTRLAEVRLVMDRRTEEELWTILDVGIGDRITITGIPVGWPQGADALVVEGISHESSNAQRVITWSTSPVVGEEPGTVGPFFRIGVSALDGPDKLPW